MPASTVASTNRPKYEFPSPGRGSWPFCQYSGQDGFAKLSAVSPKRCDGRLKCLQHFYILMFALCPVSGSLRPQSIQLSRTQPSDNRSLMMAGSTLPVSDRPDPTPWPRLHGIQCKFLEGLTRDELHDILADADERKFTAHTVIVNHEEPAAHLFLLTKGSGRHF